MKPPESRLTDEQSGQLSAWVDATLPRALSYALSLVRYRSDAEDLVHDCYVRLLAKSCDYDLPNDGAKLLFRSITNACINWHQRRSPCVSLESRGIELSHQKLGGAAGFNPEQQAMRAELESAIGDALAELPVVQRAAVELRGLGHSLADIAEILTLSDANARVILHRARQTLAKRLVRFLDPVQEHER